MKKWCSIALISLMASCTPIIDREKLELEKIIADQRATIDSLQNRVVSSGKSVSQTEVQTNDSSIPVTGKLYEKIGSSEVKDFEFAEVLALAEADTSFGSNDYEVRVYLACNGPADPDIDECNCSHYAYVSTGTYDIPNDYRLFKVGPFFMPKFSKWGSSKEQPELTIVHQVKGRTEKTVIKVLSFERISLDK